VRGTLDLFVYAMFHFYCLVLGLHSVVVFGLRRLTLYHAASLCMPHPSNDPVFFRGCLRWTSSTALLLVSIGFLFSCLCVPFVSLWNPTCRVACHNLLHR